MPRTRLRDINHLQLKGVRSWEALKDFGNQKPRPRKLVNLNPMGGVEAWGVHNNSLANLERAIVERVFTVKVGGEQVIPPQPLQGIVWKRLGPFYRQLVHQTGRIGVMTTEQFVDTYTGVKRKAYQRTADDLEVRPLERKDAFIAAFIKDEKTNLSRKSDPCPRIIQPRSKRFNLCIGKILKPMEKPIFHAMARIFGSDVVMKGLNASQRGRILEEKWARFEKPVGILLDATRFDQHCNADIIAAERRVFESVTTDVEELRRLNRMRAVNTCFARVSGGGFKYSVKGGRMSGDMDTALGNCMTMCAMTWTFMRYLGIKFEYMNDGDDGVLIVEEQNRQLVLDNFQWYFLDFGFSMKLEGIANVIEEVEFCQAQPVFNGEQYVFVRNPYICLGKDSLSLRGLTDTDSLRELSNSIGWCGLSLAGDMPIFWRFYSSMIYGDDPGRVYNTGMAFLSKGMSPKIKPPSMATRLSFQRAYRLSPDDQMAIEDCIQESYCRINSPASLVMSLSHISTTLKAFY